MAKRKTLGESPFDTVIPDPDAVPETSRSSFTPTEPHSRPEQIRLPRIAKERLTIHLPIDLIDRIKNAVYWTPGLTLASLGEEAFKKILEEMEKEHGGSFPPRKQELKGGRPMK
jgi:hypothetical protein